MIDYVEPQTATTAKKKKQLKQRHNYRKKQHTLHDCTQRNNSQEREKEKKKKRKKREGNATTIREHTPLISTIIAVGKKGRKKGTHPRVNKERGRECGLVGRNKPRLVY